MKFILSVLLSTLATCVSAHGVIEKATVAGVTYDRFQQNTIIRKVSTQDPNIGANNPALTCGPNAQAAPLSADAQPGDEMSFDWRPLDSRPWPHNTGPMITYMASCGAVSCDKFNPAQAEWFKIDEKGRKPNGGEWFQADLMTGAPATVRIPKDLAPGNYMVRHEIIALHLASKSQGAEFYPGCIQIKLGGSGTGKPTGQLVKFPGAYSDNDPGILTQSAFDAGAKYPFPGPAVSSFSSGGAAPAPVPGSDAPAPGSPAPAPAPGSGAPAPGSGSPAPGAPKPSSSPAAAAPAGSPPADAPAPAPTKGYDHGQGHCGSGKKAPKQRRNVSRQATPVDDIADETPDLQITQLRKAAVALPGLEGVKPRHFNSRIARRMAFDASLH